MPLQYCEPCREYRIPDTVCLACRVTYYCSEECHDKDRVNHRRECTPSILVDGASSTHSRLHLSSTYQEYEQKQLIRRGIVKPEKPPAVLSTREISMDPRNFVTVRLIIDGRKHTTIYLSTELDIRWRITGSAYRWDPPATLETHPSEMDNVLLIAPGEGMVADLERRRATAKGERPREIKLPDQDLIDFAQGISSNHDERQSLAHVVEWYELGTMVHKESKLV